MTILNMKTGESWGEDECIKFLALRGIDLSQAYVKGLYYSDKGWYIRYRRDTYINHEYFFLDPATYRVYDEAREAEIREVLKAEYGRVTYKADSPETDINTRTHYEGGMYSIQIVAHSLGINLEEKP